MADFFSAHLAPYLDETAGHYVHRVNGYAATGTQLQPVGQVLYQLLEPKAPRGLEMADGYRQEPTYQVAARLFAEQFRVEAEAAQPKANQEISASVTLA